MKKHSFDIIKPPSFLLCYFISSAPDQLLHHSLPPTQVSDLDDLIGVSFW